MLKVWPGPNGADDPGIVSVSNEPLFAMLPVLKTSVAPSIDTV
jgi:hypothetical protein